MAHEASSTRAKQRLKARSDTFSAAIMAEAAPGFAVTCITNIPSLTFRSLESSASSLVKTARLRSSLLIDDSRLKPTIGTQPTVPISPPTNTPIGITASLYAIVSMAASSRTRGASCPSSISAPHDGPF